MGFDYFPSHCPLLSPFLSYVPFLLSTSFFLLLCCMCVHTRETMNYFCLSRPVYLCLPWSRSIHVPASDIFVFFSMVPLWIQTTVLYFPLDGHLGWFFNLVIVNSPVVNMDDWIYLNHTVWDFYPNRVCWKDNASSPAELSSTESHPQVKGTCRALMERHDSTVALVMVRDRYQEPLCDKAFPDLCSGRLEPPTSFSDHLENHILVA